MRGALSDPILGSGRLPPLFASAQNRPENALLATLSPAARSGLQKCIRYQQFQGGDRIWRAGEAIDQVYFPCSGMISIRVQTNQGRGIEVATVGYEAAAGLFDSLHP